MTQKCFVAVSIMGRNEWIQPHYCGWQKKELARRIMSETGMNETQLKCSFKIVRAVITVESKP